MNRPGLCGGGVARISRGRDSRKKDADGGDKEGGYGGLDDPPATPDITLLEGRLNKSQAEAGILRAEVAQAHLMNPGSNPEP